MCKVNISGGALEARTLKICLKAFALDASVSLNVMLLPLCKALPDIYIASNAFEGYKLRDIHSCWELLFRGALLLILESLGSH